MLAAFEFSSPICVQLTVFLRFSCRLSLSPSVKAVLRFPRVTWDSRIVSFLLVSPGRGEARTGAGRG